ncbi:MAG: hypothetical protein EOP83_23535 [Verrucomicrobiaceae bacterium]|nr:MAG: hypothetical protein EOP83_23535 [Verrucomicrobiaceae bacterium]
MRNYLVTFHDSTDPEAWAKLSETLKENYNLWAAEPDAGLFFIAADATAPQILEHLSDAYQTELAHTLYVFEITGEWDGGGTSDVMRAIQERVPRAS